LVAANFPELNPHKLCRYHAVVDTSFIVAIVISHGQAYAKKSTKQTKKQRQNTHKGLHFELRFRLRELRHWWIWSFKEKREERKSRE